MAATVATPLERSLGRIAGITEMTSSSSLGSIAHHAAVRPHPRHRRRRARRAGGDQRGAQPAADRAAQQSDLPQGQSGRRADHDPGADLGHHDAGPDVRRRLDHHRAEALAGVRASARCRSAAARCRRCASSSIRRSSTSTASASRRAHRARRDQREPAEGIARGRRPPLADLRQRSGEEGRRVPAADRRLPQRRGGPAHRRRRGRRLGAGPAQRGLGQRQAVGADHHQPAAERQHHRDGRRASPRCCRSCARRSRARSTSTW